MGEWHHPAHFTGMAKAFAKTERAVNVQHAADHLLPHMRTAATAYGYTLALHGSMVRDLDLIAVPWRDDACDATKLIEVLCDCIKQATGWGNCSDRKPEAKPHGRVAVTITASFMVTVDLSIMPREASHGN